MTSVANDMQRMSLSDWAPASAFDHSIVPVAEAFSFGRTLRRPPPPEDLKFADMDEFQKRSAIIAILQGSRDKWGAWESSCVQIRPRGQ